MMKSGYTGGILIGLSLLLAAGLAFVLHEPATEAPPPKAAVRVAGPVKIVVFGDSLAAGHNIPREMAFPARLEAALEEAGHAVDVVNAGISGDTTAGGMTRLPAIFEHQPDIVILELGANDMLRGTPPGAVRDNLDAMLEALAKRGVYVLLAGMRVPGMAAGGREYRGIYEDLAAKHQVTLYPFFLEGVAHNPALNLADGIHPNEAGAEAMARNILPTVEAMLERLGERAGGG